MERDASEKLHLSEAIKRIGIRRLARLLDVPHPTVQSWIDRGVPEHWRAPVRAAIDAETRMIREKAGLE
jgi:hypothetical protein